MAKVMYFRLDNTDGDTPTAIAEAQAANQLYVAPTSTVSVIYNIANTECVVKVIGKHDLWYEGGHKHFELIGSPASDVYEEITDPPSSWFGHPGILEIYTKEVDSYSNHSDLLTLLQSTDWYVDTGSPLE